MARLRSALLLTTTLLLSPALLRAQAPEVRQAVDRVMAMLITQDDAALTKFANEALAESYRKSFSEAALLTHLRGLRDAAKGHIGAVAVRPSPDGSLVISLDEGRGPRIKLVPGPGGLLTALELVPAGGGGSPPPGGPAIVTETAPPAALPPAERPNTRDQARPWHVGAMRDLSRLSPEEALAMLEREHLSPGYLTRTTRAERQELVNKIRVAAAGATIIQANEDERGLHISLAGPNGVQITMTYQAAAPFGIESLTLTPLVDQGPPAGKAFAWEDLVTKLDEAARAGFSGQVVARHQGKEVLRRTYGLMDRAAQRATIPDAIYSIGSTPIDFTIAMARILAARGKMDLDAPIGRYLPNVPADKATLTTRMILEARSGLVNFHDTKQDPDPDLSWIDKATAVKRILSAPLLFPPGAQRQTSHSSHVLLAAILEEVSGMSYPELIRTQILVPLGMTRSGFYGESLGLPLAAFAVGYGPKSVGEPNIPPKWGPTSWLIMGSGGMFSTVDDMIRYYDGMAKGTLYPAGTAPAPKGGMGVGGSDRGFFFVRIDNGKGDQLYLITNNDGRGPMMDSLMQGLVPMVMGPR